MNRPSVIAGAVIFEGNKILLFYSPRWSSWTVAGGHVEMGETVEEAVKREVWEETGLQTDKVDFISYRDGVYPPDYHKKTHHVYLNFAATVRKGEITLNDEHTEYRWVSLEEARKLKLATGLLELLDHFERWKNGA